MIKVAVVMSTYNGQRYLQEQIESILRQQGCQVELLVRDDGSEEVQLSILREYQRRGKLRLICGENLKPAKKLSGSSKAGRRCGVLCLFGSGRCLDAG